MQKKFLGLFSLILVAILILAGCGNNDNDTAQKNTKSSSQTLLDQIKDRGTLKIGTEGTYAPFTYHDDNGKLTGFDVDIAKEVAKRIGVKANFVETKWDGMIAGLDSKRFDVVFNEVGVTPERKEKYDFSDPYIVSKAVLIVSKDNNDIKSFADLKGKKSGQSLTSNLSKIAEKNGAQIVSVDGFNQAIDLLTSGRIDATVNDSLSYLDLKKQKPNVPIKSVDSDNDATDSAAMIRKGNSDLVKAIDKALADMKKDGTYLKISKKYFNEDVSK
ncbi:cystine transport system substrate-binding protein [Pullulanibacillus pueri]|uniref:Amino acid ABC transporter substrate-binding protein n=1 Tax=Pullulanibacillus pueri TaxID=1437324 RepID=A0A8J2ZQZ6_9BACL|nr:amino acid ABC transporter substrate-binding protein [Pullulanibacillus pueri]MBM7679991.1 cystine transport system substrate-binding protein [Pullulanibacillus pueri]GGH73825.1 amino acid ABC transporter substrate-binding protein [Pullulanibacillus pueri]